MMVSMHGVVEEYTQVSGVAVQPPKRYLKHDTIADLINLFSYKRGATPEHLKEESIQVR
jgi:hypothetical protein